MLPATRLPLKTASAANSIWRHSNEDDFRTRVVALEKASGEVPGDPKVHSAQEWPEIISQQSDTKYQLPFLVEQRLADDLAFIAAAKEDPKAVSAATVQERSDGLGSLIRLAANDGVLPEVEDTFRAMLELLASCAHGGVCIATRALFFGLMSCDSHCSSFMRISSFSVRYEAV